MTLGDAMNRRFGIVALAIFVLFFGVTSSTAVAQDVEWTHQINVSVSGTTVQKTSGCDGCDDAGSQSQDQIDSPGGYVDFTVGEANTFWIGGLSNGNSGPSYSGIDYAFRFNGAGGADVLQNGSYKGGDTAYEPGDVFRISIAYGRVQFWRNGTVLYTSRTPPTYPLVLDVALGTVGASLYDAHLSHDLIGDPPPPPPPLTTSNITWVDKVNVTAGDRVLQKTDGCGGCDDAGAVSQEALTDDGYIEFTVGEINTFWVAGLSDGNTDTSYGDIDFGFRFNGAGVADVLENGVYKGGDTLYTVGDAFKISVVRGHVFYLHNGEVVYVSAVTPTFPLIMDTALGSADASIYNANLIPTNTGSGGTSGDYLLETAGQPPTRYRYTADDIVNFHFLPDNDAKGAFDFPRPYNTHAVRLTDASDCGGGDCVWYHGYSYWRRINNYRGVMTQDGSPNTTMYILVGLAQERGGTGPTLFSFDTQSDHVENRGGLFVCRPDEDPAVCDARDPGHAYYNSTAEMWYFSRNDPYMLYVFNVGSKQLRRYDVEQRTFAELPAMDLAQCGDVCPAAVSYFDHPHTSDDDAVHSANVRDAADKSIGCVVHREHPAAGVQPFSYYEPEVDLGYSLDECVLDKSGTWLVMHETKPDPNDPTHERLLDDERVFNLDTGDVRHVDDAAGAQSSHSGLGYGYSAGPDDKNANASATTVMKFPVGENPGRDVVQYDYSWFNGNSNGGTAAHVSHENAVPGNPEQQYACGSNGTKSTLFPWQDEIVCFMLNPARNLQPDGTNPLDLLVVAPTMTDLDKDGGFSDYQRRPKGSLDISGDYFIWTTNMAGHGHRLDMFIVKVPKDTLVNAHH